MKKLTKEQSKAFHTILEGLNSAKDKIEDVLERMHRPGDPMFTRDRGELIAALQEYEGRCDSAASLCGEIVSLMRDFFEARSERWQEGEAGEAFASWLDAWEQLDGAAAEVSYKPSEEEGDYPLAWGDVVFDNFLEDFEALPLSVDEV